MKKKIKKESQSFSVMILMIFIIVMVLLMTYSYAYPVMTVEGEITADIAQPIAKMDNKTIPSVIDTTTITPGTNQVYSFSVSNQDDLGNVATRTTRYQFKLTKGENTSLNYAIYEVIDGITQPTNLLTTTKVETLPHTTPAQKQYQLVIWRDTSMTPEEDRQETIELTVELTK